MHLQKSAKCTLINWSDQRRIMGVKFLGLWGKIRTLETLQTLSGCLRAPFCSPRGWGPLVSALFASLSMKGYVQIVEHARDIFFEWHDSVAKNERRIRCNFWIISLVSKKREGSLFIILHRSQIFYPSEFSGSAPGAFKILQLLFQIEAPWKGLPLWNIRASGGSLRSFTVLYSDLQWCEEVEMKILNMIYETQRNISIYLVSSLGL
jgi:hypothetical protein